MTSRFCFAYSLEVLYRYCIPTDTDARMFTAAELEFFDKCDPGKGKFYFHLGFSEHVLHVLKCLAAVPVIVIFTKFDSLEAKAFRTLRNEGWSRQDAKAHAPERANSDFERDFLPNVFGRKYPPKKELRLRCEPVPIVMDIFKTFNCSIFLFQICTTGLVTMMLGLP